MKILQINAVNSIDSTGRITTELHNYLIEHGHQSWVAAMNVSDSEEFFHLGHRIEDKVHSFLSRLTGRQACYSHWSTKRLIHFIDSKKPDVVCLGVLHSNCVNLPKLLGFLGRNDYPVVITLHDCWYFTGHCCYFTGAGCERWKNGCGNCPELHTWNKSWFFDNTGQNLMLKKKLFSGIRRLAVVGVSDWVTSFVHDSILSNAKVIRRIYNWIDLNIFYPKENRNEIRERLGINTHFTIICIATKWSTLKGIHDVIALARGMDDCRVLLVGTCPEEYQPLPENVIAVGSTTSAMQLADYYSAADVFFNPSVQETFGKVTAEALACGTPVVAYGVTATVELVQPGCGYLVKSHDINESITKLNLIREKGRNAYIDNCREFAVSSFCKETLIEENLNLYRQLIAL